MNKPKHQHFIPKAYLKNFAVNQNDKFLVEGKLRGDNSPKKDLISIKDICVNKNLYTIPNKDGDDKYALENYYADQIDSVYPEVYELLVNPKIVKIEPEQRIKIIMTTMSLFFRTPKFLNDNQRTINALLTYAVQNAQDKEGNIKFKFKEFDLDFNIKDIEEVRTNLKIGNKVKFLQGHLADWHDFVNFKLKAAISVYKIYDEIELITSDNPVIMHSVKDNPFSLFDPTNIISLPLDNKHYLTIFPNTEEAMLNTIYRADRDKWFALTTNLQVEKSCEDWVLGKPNSVTAHINDQVTYNNETSENLKAVEDIRKRGEDGIALLTVMEEYGFVHVKVAEKVREMLKQKIHSEDLEIQKIAKRLNQFGLKTE